MYLAIITLPLLGSIVSGFFGRKVGVSGAQLITCTSVIVTTLLAIIGICLLIDAMAKSFQVGLHVGLVFLFSWISIYFLCSRPQ
jgi:NADH-ubiquinone oxidoreductase chain 5